MKLKIKKGDLVEVIAGADRGHVGKVLDVYPKKMRILVEGANIHKRHERPNPNNQQGGIIEKEMPMHYSNVMIVDSDNKTTRIGIRQEVKDNKRVSARFSISNGKDL